MQWKKKKLKSTSRKTSKNESKTALVVEQQNGPSDVRGWTALQDRDEHCVYDSMKEIPSHIKADAKNMKHYIRIRRIPKTSEYYTYCLARDSDFENRNDD